MPYDQYMHSNYEPHHPSPYIRPRDHEIVALTERLDDALHEINRLSLLVSPPSPQQPPARIHVPLAQLNVPSARASPHPSHSPSRPGLDSVFKTITSTSRAASHHAPDIFRASVAGSIAASSSDTDYDDLLPVPKADTCSGAEMSSVPVPDVFSSKELAAMPCTCEPADVGAWDVMIMGRIAARKPAAARVLRYTDDEIAAMPPAARAVVQGYDIMLAGAFIATLQGHTKPVRLRRSIIARRESKNPGTVTSSGRAIRAIILEIVTPTCGSELETLEAALKQDFFSMGMSDIDISLNAHRMEALRAQLPASARGGERELLRMLIDKFPPELSAKATDYKSEMCKAEVRKKPYEWTYEELTAILASHITSSPVAEANNTEYPRGGGGGAFGTPEFKGCLNCGFDNHTTRKCTAPPCGYCGLRFCFGARKRGTVRGCLVKRVVEGGKIGDADLGLNGRPLPASVIEKLNEKAAALKAKSAEVNAAGVQTDPPLKNVIDDDDSGAEESDHCELFLASHVCC